MKILNKAKIWLIVLLAVVVAGIAMLSIPALGLNKSTALSDGYEVHITTEIDFSDNTDTIKETADEFFKDNGLNYTDYYLLTEYTSNSVFVFAKEVDADDVSALQAKVDSALNEGSSNPIEVSVKSYKASTLTRLSVHVWAMVATAIALVVIGAYLMIRQRFVNAFTAMVVAVIEIALFLALTALTRAVVTTAYGAIFALGVALSVVLTVLYTGKIREATRKHAEDEKTSALELAEKAECSNVKATALALALLALFAIALIVAGIFTGSALIWTGVALIACAVSVAFTVIFVMPSVWLAFRKIGDKK